MKIFVKGCNNCNYKKMIEFSGEVLPEEINIEQANDLAMRTDYAHKVKGIASEVIGMEINKADAGAFFLEGYNAYRQKAIPIVGKLLQRIKELEIEVSEGL